MSKMRFIAMGVAGAAALGAAFLANGFLNKPVKKEIVEVSKVSMTPVLVALQEIRMGDVLNASNVGWKDWPSDQVRQFMIDKPGNEDFFQKLEGTRARANMFEGEAVNRERIVNIGAGNKLDGNAGNAFSTGGGDLFHPFKTLELFLYRNGN